MPEIASPNSNTLRIHLERSFPAHREPLFKCHLVHVFASSVMFPV